MTSNNDMQPERKKPGTSENSGAPRAQESTTPEKGPGAGFPVVAIGASAGGLEAFERFFSKLPPDSGMAFVLIQHLDPHHKSMLGSLLKRYTRMEVMEAEDGMLLEPNRVFVIPPNCRLAVHHGKLHLLEPLRQEGLHTPIDYFFRSLATDQKENAAGIILSGTGSDGAFGLGAIRDEGGMTMVQDPQTAKYNGMPRNVLATASADYILPPDKMPEQLIAYFQHPSRGTAARATLLPHSIQGSLLEKVFLLIRSHTGHDFTNYKQNTIARRIERRMAVNRIAQPADYIRFLQGHSTEVDILFKELLIGVTSFFRDKEAFGAIREKVLSQLFQNHPAGRPLRIWVPGCATGEEAYSLAILCHAARQEKGRDLEIQIFATDLDPSAINFARMGVYPQNIAADVPKEFLGHYFEQENSSFRVRKKIRDLVVFALQNVLSDPPFSRIDLISCRNLLIYLDTVLQKKALSFFHYSLNQRGFLFLGTSETPGEQNNYFAVIDRKWKIFQRKEITPPGQLSVQVPVAATLQYGAAIKDIQVNHLPPQRDLYRNVAERIILDEYGPSGVLIDENNNILFIRGRTGKYLEPPDGIFTGDILAMAREGLKLPLANAIHSAKTKKIWIRSENIVVKTNGGKQPIKLVVKPVANPISTDRLLLVIFEEMAKEAAAEIEENIQPDTAAQSAALARIMQLEQELQYNKEYLQKTIEEFSSSNEELQSTNEELQTSKEELQSINEELITVNHESEKKIEELSLISSDLKNFLSSTEIGTLFLDTELKIRRFTPDVTRCINLIPGDIGRPVGHISSNLTNNDHLVEDGRYVLQTLKSREKEVQTGDGSWFIMRIIPYRTIEQKIDGVVVTFVDITARRRLEQQLEDSYALLEQQKAVLLENNERLKKEAEERLQAQHELAGTLEEARQAREFADSIIGTVRGPLLVLDGTLHIIRANRSFYDTFGVTPLQTEDKYIYELGNGQWNTPRLRKLLEDILPQREEFNDFLVEHDFPLIGQRAMLLNARRIPSSKKVTGKELILLAMEDITDRDKNR